jgi:hypothetical protein
MGESLTGRRRVNEEGLRVVKFCQEGRMAMENHGLTLPPEEALANSVPAAAVIRRGQALFGITGHKAHVGGFVSRL